MAPRRMVPRRGASSPGHAPSPPPPGHCRQGLHPLGLGAPRDGLLRVPAPPIEGALPLIVMLHGYGSGAERVLRRLLPIADAALILLPESLGATWDVLEGGYGPDIQRLDAALSSILAAWPIDPARLAVAGFSDGASYALSLAMMNGALFSHALAFSPGFAAPMRLEGKPQYFISHGTADDILPIDHCSRRLMPKLQRAGYQGQYLQFPGGHEVPAAIAQAAMDFLNAG